MSAIAIGQPVPDIELAATGDKNIKLADFHGKPIVLYFYPKASTPGCTQEGLDFSAAIAKFRRQSAIILGASRDSLKAQENFKQKQGFPFDLISDKEEILCQAFDVIKMKSMYGKQVRGIERSTFLIDETGLLRVEWRKVKVKGHAEEVLDTLKAMRAGKLL
ncbi:MAG: peroxiredoxin [Candidatus Thiodiazotropha sp. (ex Lucinoma borealis)]|nr:peroxiredoxin [Candidatus Thiodiazotropha sp. (ex Lucinoma borealis)]